MYEFADSLFFEKGLSIRINNDTASPFLFVDYDFRYPDLNMTYEHFHDFYEIMIPIDDGVSHLIGGRYITLKRGDVLFLRPHMLHKSIYSGAGERRIIIDFRLPEALETGRSYSTRILQPFFLDNPVLRLKGGQSSELTVVLNRIFQKGKELKAGWQIEIFALFVLLLVEATRLMPMSIYQSERMPVRPLERMYPIAEYIETHYKEQITLPDLAERFSISPYYLSRQFSKAYDVSIITYLHRARVRNALQMLSYTDADIQDVIQSCGFSSASQFSRVFRNFCSMSPSSFRRLPLSEKEIILSSVMPEAYENAGVALRIRSHIIAREKGARAGRTVALESYALRPLDMVDLKRKLDVLRVDSILLDIPACFPAIESYRALSKRTLRALKSLSMNISILGYTPPDDSYSGISECIAALDAASELSAPVLTISPLPSDENGFQRLMDFLVDIMPEAESRGIIMTTGPKPGTAIPDIPSMLRLMDAFPEGRLKALLSPMDLTACKGGENTFSFFDEVFFSLSGRISALLLKDSLDGRRVNLGKGMMARTYPRISALLADSIPIIRAGSSEFPIADDLDYIRKVFL